jgi:hypothetical protein
MPSQFEPVREAIRGASLLKSSNGDLLPKSKINGQYFHKF